MTRWWVYVAILAGLCAAGGPASAQAAGSSEASAVLLIAETEGEASRVNFGASAVANGETERSLKAALEKLGLTVVPSGSLTPMVGESQPGLPLGDKAAANMAQQAGARLAVTVGVVGRSEGPVRATNLVGHAVKLRVRILDLVAGEAIYDQEMQFAGYGSDPVLAQKLATSRALSRLMPALRAKVATRFPSEAANGSAMSIRIRGAQGWREIGAILSKLASTQGVEAVHAIEIRQDQVRLGVQSGLSTASMVSSLRRARIPNGSLAVMANGNEITIELTITSSTQPILNG